MSDTRSLDARQLESIQYALTRHAEVCLSAPTGILLNPEDHERLGWEEFRGIPVKPHPSLRPLRVRIECERHGVPMELALEVDAYSSTDERFRIVKPREMEPAVAAHGTSTPANAGYFYFVHEDPGVRW